ncbi:MAG TPA: hypothetical protein VKZ53_04975 [Candidatus Angelobacter sp.]|nr:hypothetical protein [Candidatus Angelobacter sp.]
MAKDKPFIDVTRPIPEWGLSEEMSRAVPMAGSGVEIKSTRDISSSMRNRIRAAIDVGTLREAHKLVADSKEGKHSGTIFTSNKVLRSEVLFKEKEESNRESKAKKDKEI